ncbi:MAG: SOS response-associated peptidase [Nitrospiraceae bacterium]
MCGRFTQTATPDTIAKLFRVEGPLPLFKPSYNIAPTQRVAAVRLNAETGKRECALLRWGLIPSWANDAKIGNQCINAKAETLAEKPSFRSAFRKRRCLVVADGFYEWQLVGALRGVRASAKQPMWIGRKDRQPFAFAGLWEYWEPAEGEPLETCAIITTEPNELMAPIHNRMPVVLGPASFDQWLDAATPAESLKALLRPCPGEELQAYPVSPLVNNPRNNAPQLLDQVSV